jgi:hypothetical protein
MNREALSYKDTDNWTWNKAVQNDVLDILNLVEQNYQSEIEHILTPNRTKMTYHLQKAILEQVYKPNAELLSIAREKGTRKILAWGWVVRGKFTVYANEEMAVAEFAHTDLSLPVRTRMRLMGQLFDQWIAWCALHEIPVLCSTSIRDDQSGFMRLHDHYGFSRKGSFAYLKVTDELAQ